MVCRTDASSSIASSAERSARAGFILVPVLWIVFFLTMAVATFTLAIRANVQQTSSASAAAEAAALAEAGINLAILDLVNAQADGGARRRFPPDGQPYGCGLGNGRIVIVVRDEAGKVDINHAGERLLVALLKGAGASGADAARLAAAIVDYRDADSTRLPGGAEAPEYKQAGRAVGPKNAPFDQIFELAHVLGIVEPLLSRLLPHVTVHAGISGVDPGKATPALLAILDAGAAGLETRLDETPPRSATSPLSPMPRLSAELSGVSAQRAFSITAEATGARRGLFAREAVIRLTRSGARPYQQVSWRQVNASPDTAAADIGPC